MDGHRVALEQRGQALDVPTGHGATDVVCMMVSDQDAVEAKAVVLDDVEDVADRVGRVDCHRLAGLAVTD